MSRHAPTAAGIPVVVVHGGSKPYVRFCIRRAVDSNPRGRVVLLGDAATAGIGAGEHIRLDDAALQDDIAEFRTIYEHLGPAETHRFERFCIERWFVIRNFMRRDGLDRCLVVDSDVLLFCDVTEEAARFRGVAMTFARWDAVRLLPHCNFINGRDALESFCNHVLEVYRRPARLEAVKAANAKKLGRHWVSDMSLFHDWASHGGFRIGMLEDALQDGSAYDDGLDRTAGFARRAYLPGVLRTWKWIEYRDGVPHARHHRAGLVPMRCLHFHGMLKTLMGRHAACRDDDWGSAALMLKVKLAKWPQRTRIFIGDYLLPRGRGRAAIRRAA